jgi:hypothetical protein
MRLPAVRVFEFHGDRLPTLEVEGKPCVALRAMVEALGASWVGQVERLKRDPVLNPSVRVTRTQLPGDVQSREVTVLPVEMVPLFLAKISIKRVKPELREKLIRYQTECGKALYDYWFGGVAIRGDHEGVVTDLSPAVRGALGGIVKGIIAKALAEILPAMVRENIGSRHHAVVEGVSAGQVLEMAGVGKRKGLRGMAVWVSHRLRRFHAFRGVAVRMGSLGSSNAYVFDPLVSREWLDEGGRSEIEKKVAERRGQGALRLV